jgi:two-component system sensor histidine kinase MprB
MTSPLDAGRTAVARLDRRWRDLPLRTRLTSAAALAATVTIVAVVAVAYLAVRHELRGQVDKDLRRQASDVHLTLQPDLAGGYDAILPRTIDEPTGYVQAVDYRGTVSPPSVIPVTARDKRIAADGGSWVRDAYINGKHVRLLTAQSRYRGVALQIALSLRGVDHQLHTLALAFVVLALGGLALTVVTSWGVVRRTMRPVRTLTETAEQIAQTRDLTVRISSLGNDEIGRLAATFNVMLDELERSLNAQRQLVLDASHELRTPLASLRTNVEILGDIDRLSPEQRRATLAGIVSQLEELTGLVADVVELARGEAPPSLYDDVGLDELVERAVERARRHWPGIVFDAETAPVRVRAVATRLDRAVANMLDNAGKFSPPGTRVDVRLRADGTLTVADRGPGIPEQSLPFVFDRFYRADEARGLPGSGLGLAIVKQVVDEHGGAISLDNRPGGGAVATLTLPTLPFPEPAAAVAPTPVEGSLFR